jgi:hypothetical protein
MSSHESRSRFAGRGFIAAAIVVAIIVLAAIVVLVTSIAHGTNPKASGPTPTSSKSTSESDGEKSICGLPGFNQSNTLTAAPTEKWVLVGTVAAPSSNSAGPGTIKSGLRTCYAHTAEGALFMAANFIAMGSDATLGPRLVDLVAPGAGRKALASKPSSSSSSSQAQVAGFKVGGYSADNATVEIVMNYADGSLVSIPLKLVWAEGDWKVVLTNSGDFPLAPSQIQNLGGYTPWSGA